MRTTHLADKHSRILSTSCAWRGSRPLIETASVDAADVRTDRRQVCPGSGLGLVFVRGTGLGLVMCYDCVIVWVWSWTLPAAHAPPPHLKTGCSICVRSGIRLRAHQVMRRFWKCLGKVNKTRGVPGCILGCVQTCGISNDTIIR